MAWEDLHLQILDFQIPVAGDIPGISSYRHLVAEFSIRLKESTDNWSDL